MTIHGFERLRHGVPASRIDRALRPGFRALRAGIVAFGLGVVFLTPLAPPGGAAFAEKSGEKSKAGKDGKGALDATMDMAGLVAPVARNGRLVNYIFLTLRIEFQPGAPIARLRDRGEYMRDALIIALHKTDITLANDPAHVDEKIAIPLFVKTLEASEGAGNFKSVTIASADSRETFPAPR